MHLSKTLITILLIICCPAVFSAPSVVVSIKPLHSLVAAVMEGVGEPYLLIKNAQSPHHLTLKPSQAKAILDADLFVWVGPVFERFLKQVHQNAQGKDIQLITLDGLKLLPTRGSDHKNSEGHSEIDGHFWLDPTNAMVVVSKLAEELQSIDPENSHFYQANTQRLQLKLKKLDERLKQLLHPFQGVPYLTYHDALQYFERHYGLNGVAITIQPEQQLGVKSSLRVRQLILERGVKCIFREPQFRPKLLDILIDELSLRDGVVDPIGIDVMAGSEGYFALMENLGMAFERCLPDQR